MGFPPLVQDQSKMTPLRDRSQHARNDEGCLDSKAVFWRVEGSLLNLSAVRPVAFFTWNAQSFLERWARRNALGMSALIRPALYAAHRVIATRILHTLLCGVSQDRLNLLGEEYFQYILMPRLKRAGLDVLREVQAQGATLVLVSQGLDHVMVPLAQHLGVDHVVVNRLEFRDGLATGRLLEPVIRPRGGLARLIGGKPDGRVSRESLSRQLGFPEKSEILLNAVIHATRRIRKIRRAAVMLDQAKKIDPLSIHRAYNKKHVLLIGATGFIGKVWLAMALSKIPNIGRIYLLIRRQRSTSAVKRFEKIIQESPLFEPLHAKYDDRLSEYISARLEVIEGDVTEAGLGLDPGVSERLTRNLDLIINSSGLTDFNPDIRTALAVNTESTLHLLKFQRQCDHAAMLHLSTCYVAGARDGRVHEELKENYNPIHIDGFDAEKELRGLQAHIQSLERRSESPEITEELRRQALDRTSGDSHLSGPALENQIRKNRIRWLRSQFVEAGMQRARELGWPNTYTLTKSLAESLIAKLGAGLPIAVVRPSIVESSIKEPFVGWNEGVNTSAPISYLLGTYFRQLPTNERKCLDLIPVDTVCRGMLLIGAALIERRHARLYQLATSATNPCDMGRSIELTSLAHRKHFRAQEGLESWLRARFDTIPVSKARYQKLSAPGQKALLRTLQKIGSFFAKRRPLQRKERGLERVEKLIELYEPFILHNEHVFEADRIELLSVALPPEEQDEFGYDTVSLDWWEYWINIHVPALRKWSYPLIEGKPLEAHPHRSFQLQVAETAGS
jgi:thioester reductase-like protein